MSQHQFVELFHDITAANWRFNRQTFYVGTLCQERITSSLGCVQSSPLLNANEQFLKVPLCWQEESEIKNGRNVSHLSLTVDL